MAASVEEPAVSVRATATNSLALLAHLTANDDRCGAALRPPIGPKSDGSALKVYRSSRFCSFGLVAIVQYCSTTEAGARSSWVNVAFCMLQPACLLCMLRGNFFFFVVNRFHHSIYPSSSFWLFLKIAGRENVSSF